MKSSPFQGLFYPASSTLQFEAFCDNYWGSSFDSSGMLKSIIGMCLMLRSSLVIWHSTKQKVILRSTAKAQLRAIADTAREISWFSLLLSELQVPQSPPIVVHNDNLLGSRHV